VPPLRRARKEIRRLRKFAKRASRAFLAALGRELDTGDRRLVKRARSRRALDRADRVTLSRLLRVAAKATAKRVKGRRRELRRLDKAAREVRRLATRLALKRS
jgi:hypothetical protein